MWYFTWAIGIGFAVMLAILNAMWGETELDRLQSQDPGHDGEQ
jgi:cyd operon protein YbgT